MPAQFGWIPPAPEKQAQNNRYKLSRWQLPVPEMGAVEKILPYPKEYVSYYDQPNNSCTAYSASWITSIYNLKKYNADWLYCEAGKIDNDPSTSCAKDQGGYIWSTMDILRLRGHCIDRTTTPILAEGIVSYGWADTIDGGRSAINEDHPIVFGTYWYDWSIVMKNGERWISDTGWNGILGN